MPDEAKGIPEVGTADMHGGGVTFKDREGNDVSFEVVRLGTSKEHETVKAALETAKTQLHTSGRQRQDFHDRLAAMMDKRDAAEAAYKTEKEAAVKREQQLRILTDEAHGLRDKLDSADQHLADADTAYKAEKETSADLNNALNDDRARLTKLQAELAAVQEQFLQRASTAESLRTDLATAIGEKEALDTSCDNFKRELLSARAELTSQNEITDGLSDEAESFRAEIADVRSELESVKTAADVSKVERDRYEKERDEAIATAEDAERVYNQYRADHVTMTTELAGVKGERDVSRQALADLTAELLRESEGIMSYFKMMHETYGGE